MEEWSGRCPSAGPWYGAFSTVWNGAGTPGVAKFFFFWPSVIQKILEHKIWGRLECPAPVASRTKYPPGYEAYGEAQRLLFACVTIMGWTGCVPWTDGCIIVDFPMYLNHRHDASLYIGENNSYCTCRIRSLLFVSQLCSAVAHRYLQVFILECGVNAETRLLPTR